jgi:hypothetical protein
MAIAQFIVLALSGMFLGLRFRIPMLLVTSALCLLATAAESVARGDGFWHSAMAVALTLTALQCGYLVGITSVLSVAKPRTRSGSEGAGITAIQRPAH